MSFWGKKAGICSLIMMIGGCVVGIGSSVMLGFGTNMTYICNGNVITTNPNQPATYAVSDSSTSDPIPPTSDTPTNISVEVPATASAQVGKNLIIIGSVYGLTESESSQATYQWIDANNTVYGTNLELNIPAKMELNNVNLFLVVTLNGKNYESNPCVVSITQAPNNQPNNSDKKIEIGVGSLNYLQTWENGYNVGNLVAPTFNSYQDFVSAVQKRLDQVGYNNSDESQFCQRVILANALMISGAVLVSVAGLSIIIGAIITWMDEHII